MTCRIVLPPFLVLFLFALLPGVAAAGEWCGGHGGGLRGWGARAGDRCHAPRLGPSWRRYARSRDYGCLHERRFIARGQSWTLLRRYLDTTVVPPRHAHPRCTFLPRWPCALGTARPTLLGHACPGEDFPHTECDLVTAALEGDETTLGTADRLARAMERFYRGAFAEAEGDFEAVAREAPDEARAHAGILLCSFMQNDVPGASRALRRLLDLDEVSAADRLDLEGSLAEPSRFTDIRDAMATASRWHFHRVEPLVVTAWAHAWTGEKEAARAQLRAALRFAPEHPVALRLRATLDDEPRHAPATEPASDAGADLAHHR